MTDKLPKYLRTVEALEAGTPVRVKLSGLISCHPDDEGCLGRLNVDVPANKKVKLEDAITPLEEVVDEPVLVPKTGFDAYLDTQLEDPEVKAAYEEKRAELDSTDESVEEVKEEAKEEEATEEEEDAPWWRSGLPKPK